MDVGVWFLVFDLWFLFLGFGCWIWFMICTCLEFGSQVWPKFGRTQTLNFQARNKTPNHIDIHYMVVFVFLKCVMFDLSSNKIVI